MTGSTLLLLLSGSSESSSIWQDCFTNDEQIAQRAPADFDLLAPHQELVARGDDGVIAPGSWKLYSPGIDFQAQGVQDGHVVRLKNWAVVREDRKTDHLGFGSVDGHELTTRRIGQAAGFGQRPAPTSGTAKVEFEVYTFFSQILNLSNEIRETLDAEGYSVDDAVAANLGETLEKLCVAWVLKEAYEARISEGGPSQGGAAVAGNSPYTLKARIWKEERDRLLARIYQKLGIVPPPDPGTIAPTVTAGIYRSNVRGRRASASEMG